MFAVSLLVYMNTCALLHKRGCGEWSYLLHRKIGNERQLGFCQRNSAQWGCCPIEQMFGKKCSEAVLGPEQLK